ncbi:unnamed protein product [Mytilus coruscus]|uniref:carbonic anhydrase n=1 Tax=Mytilus coruscus TaxID=42192 RepID=A0A6J8C7M2_MYTCO|nr:unnamed protein product [Mytilus coruscus]
MHAIELPIAIKVMYVIELSEAIEGMYAFDVPEAIEVKVGFPDYQPTIQGGGLPGPHKLSGFHFHWGRNSGIGSEHTINGYKFAMEAGSYNPNYKHFVSKLIDIKNNGEKVVLDNFPIMDLLPKTTSCWYRHCGSLTTPPCTETVIWILFENSISMSEYQLKAFRKLMGEPEIFTEGDNNIVDNFRPVHPLLQRKVALSCPCSRKNPFGQTRRETEEYGCINHGYGFKRSQQTYSPHSSGSDICQWLEYLLRK